MAWAGAMLVELGEDLSLHVQDFRTASITKSASLAASFRSGVKEIFLRAASATSLVIFPFSTLPGKIGIRKFFGFFQNFGNDIGAGGLVAMDGAEQGNLMPHVAGADHADFFDILDFHGFPPSCKLKSVLQCVRCCMILPFTTFSLQHWYRIILRLLSQ